MGVFSIYDPVDGTPIWNDVNVDEDSDAEFSPEERRQLKSTFAWLTHWHVLTPGGALLDACEYDKYGRVTRGDGTTLEVTSIHLGEMQGVCIHTDTLNLRPQHIQLSELWALFSSEPVSASIHQGAQHAYLTRPHLSDVANGALNIHDTRYASPASSPLKAQVLRDAWARLLARPTLPPSVPALCRPEARWDPESLRWQWRKRGRPVPAAETLRCSVPAEIGVWRSSSSQVAERIPSGTSFAVSKSSGHVVMGAKESTAKRAKGGGQRRRRSTRKLASLLKLLGGWQRRPGIGYALDKSTADTQRQLAMHKTERPRPTHAGMSRRGTDDVALGSAMVREHRAGQAVHPRHAHISGSSTQD